MATPMERAQAIADRGIQDQLSPDKKAKFDELVKRGLITIPGVKGGQQFDVSDPEGQRQLQTFLGRDPDVSQAGVNNMAFRAGLSRMDTPEERESFLTDTVGEKGFSRDKFGNLTLTPEGAKRLGQETDKPVIIDEPGFSRSDIADLRGVAPAIAGGVAGGFASTGLGIPAAAGITGLTSAAFKGIDEAADALRGQNIQTLGGVGKDLLTEGALAATGETVFRGILAPLGRKILAPNAARMLPGAEELVEESTKIGVRPKMGNLVNRKILTRISGMVDTIFGDLQAPRNAKALNVRMKSLRDSFGRQLDGALDIGARIKSDIRGARREFGQAANVKFALVDEFARGRNLIDTVDIKKTAQELLNALPKSKTGKPVLTSGERLKDLNDIISLPDNITVEQLQALRTTLFDKMEFGTPVPGIGSREARLLVNSANKTVDDAIEGLTGSTTPDDVLGKQALDALKDAREFYKSGISKFDNATVKRIMKDPSIAGSLDPEKVVDLVFKKGSVTPLKRVMDILPRETADEIRGEAMGKILDSATRESRQPLIDAVFDGTNLLKTLNSFGEATLDTMFGAGKRKELYTLARVIQAASKPEGASGGIVAASIAVRPLQNLSRLVKFRAMAQLLKSENGVKWLTHGIRAPKTRAGSTALARLSAQILASSNERSNPPERLNEQER